MKTNLILSSILLFFLLISCEKNAGEGGNSTIYGSVWVRDYNSTFTLLQGEYAGADEDIYIVYGDNIGYDDAIKTDYLGNFQFKYLRPGSYKVYIYSKDSTQLSPSGDIAIVKEVEITGKNQNVQVPEITIIK